MTMSTFVSRPSLRPSQTRSSLVISAKATDERLAARGGGKLAKGEGKVKRAWKWNPSTSRWQVDTKATETWDTTQELPVVRAADGSTYVIWPAIHTYLTEKDLKSISPEEAKSLMDKGRAVLVDVRKERAYRAQRAEGSVSLPLFVPVTENTPWAAAKRVVYASLAMEAAVRNPTFREDALKMLPKNKTIIVACDMGGSLDTRSIGPGGRKICTTDAERAFGRESRSLKACFELMEAGFRDVVHLAGGIPQWRVDGMPLEEGK